MPEQSETQLQIIFKDSTTCGISAHARERLLQGYGLPDGKAGFNYLDLPSLRQVAKLAGCFQILADVRGSGIRYVKCAAIL